MRWLTLLFLFVSRAAAEPLVNTFSIVAYDPRTGDLGVAVESKYLAVGAVVPWARAGIGAVASQALGKLGYGIEGLELMGQGKSSEEALEQLFSADNKRTRRQVAMIDAKGRVAVRTGDECMEWAGHRTGEFFSVQGNLLTGENVVAAMAAAFEKARASGEGELADWMMAALEAGQAAGGDRRGQQSAALLVVRANGGPGRDNDRYIDLRVDDHPTPISELSRLLRLHREFHPRK
ncbi:MAG TPA: DUF1028 domain-containing protein [Chthoniobacteraceae bacterium]|nr:DUF1028 domain-containing protein [Chthoniobacteraceae bacterium]